MMTNTKHILFASLISIVAACGGGPSVDTLADHLCTCDEQADGVQWDTAMRTACVNSVTTYLEQQSDDCLSCLDEKVGGNTTAAACASADSCTACRDDGE